MKIKMEQLTLENFRAHTKFTTTFCPDGTTTISGANGAGKTSIYDAFLWLLFGKSSDGRSDYDYRPLDAKNQPVRGLVVAVEAVLTIDGYEHTFRKEEHEHVTKAGKYSYPASYWIDEVPELLKDYQSYIEDIVPEDTFKILTDLGHFNAKMHWTARRQILLDIAGNNVGTPTGFDKLLGLLNGRTVDDMKKVLLEQKKAHEEERREIEPQVRTHQKYSNYQMPESELELTGKREICEETIRDIDAERKKVLDQQVQRQKDINALNKLTIEQLHRGSVVKFDTSGIDTLRAKAEQLRTKDVELRTKAAMLAGRVRELQAANSTTANELSQTMLTRTSIQAEYRKAKEKPVDAICYACGQGLPADKVEDLDKKRRAELDAIKERGNSIQATIKRLQVEIGSQEVVVKEAIDAQRKAQANLIASEGVSTKRLSEIEAEILDCPGKKPEDDAEWQDLDARVKTAKAELGDHSIPDVLEELESRKSGAEAMRDKYRDALRNADTAQKAKASIAELDAREKDLSQKIADCDGQLHDIGLYKAAENSLIAAAVNDRFKHVEFRLFRARLNGEIEDCCVALYKGRPYPEMSTGEKIICGVDVVNVLSTYYTVEVTLFVDHAESLTLPLGAKSQVIELRAVPGFGTELQIKGLPLES